MQIDCNLKISSKGAEHVSPGRESRVPKGTERNWFLRLPFRHRNSSANIYPALKATHKLPVRTRAGHDLGRAATPPERDLRFSV